MEDGVQVRKDDEPHGLGLLADFRGEFEDLIERGAVLECALAGTLDHRAVRQRVAEGDTELDDRGSGCDGSKDDLARGSEIRVPRGDVGDQGRLSFEVKRHGGIVNFRLQISDCHIYAAQSEIYNLKSTI